MTTARPLSRSLLGPTLAVTLLLGAGSANGCEGCKSSMSADTAAQDAGTGFAASIYFMLAMPALLVGGISWAAFKNIRQIEIARRIEAEQQAAH